MALFDNSIWDSGLWADSVWAPGVWAGPGSTPNETIAEIIAQYTQASSWYDPSDPATVWQDVAGTVPALVGTPVARIDDKGNLGLHATQSTPANRPTLQQDGQRVYLQFASGQTLIIPTGMPAPTTGLSSFVSWRHEGYPGQYPQLYFQRGSTFDQNHRHPMHHVINNDSLAQLIGTQTLPTSVGATPINNDYLSTNYLAADNISRRAFLNGALYGTATSPTLGDAGDNPTGHIANHYLGRIYEIVHIQHGITDNHRLAIESAMAAKSGVAL